MSSRLKMQVLNHIFKLIIMEHGGTDYLAYVTSDFLKTCFSAMNTLYEKKKHNLVIQLCKCFESVNGVSRIPLDRMPFGLLVYNIRFYASSRTNLVGYEEHYLSWLGTMFAQFGHKWLCLHRCPAWQYETVPDQIQSTNTSHSGNFRNSLVDIALQESGLDLNSCNEDVGDIKSFDKTFKPRLAFCTRKRSFEVRQFFLQPRVQFWSLVGNLIIEKFLKFVKLFLLRVFLGGYLRAIGRKRVSRGLK